MKQEIKNKDIVALPLFYKIQNSPCRYILLRGSTRSGKSVAIIQYILEKFCNNPKIYIVIGIEAITAGGGIIIKLFRDWVEKFGLMGRIHIDNTRHKYTHPNGSVIRFFPADKDTKWFGLEADIIWFNEAPHIKYEIFEQVQMRLPDQEDFNAQIILDYNPTDPHSWVRDLEIADLPGGVDLFTSTFYDNPFLGEKQIKLYEMWKETNWNKWLVFGMGEYGEVAGAVYTNWYLTDEFPEVSQYWYGLDFGYSNDRTALIKVALDNGELFIEEILYELSLTATDIVIEFERLNIDKQIEIVTETARPEVIEELRRAGYFLSEVKKGTGSILAGIDMVQRYKLNVVKPSPNLHDELVNYTWMKRSGKYINVAIDKWNDCLDALRYCVMMKLNTDTGPSKFRVRKLRKR